jgi:hypothetical protein
VGLRLWTSSAPSFPALVRHLADERVYRDRTYSPAYAAAVVPQIGGIGRPCMETGSGVVVG